MAASIAKPITTTTKPRTHTQAKILKAKQEHPELTTREIGAICNADHSTVVQTYKRYGISGVHKDLYKRNRAEILAGLQDRILSSVTNDDIEKASLFQKAGVFGLLYDKERLESGLSTANMATLHGDIAALRAQDKAVDNPVDKDNHSNNT